MRIVAEEKPVVVSQNYLDNGRKDLELTRVEQAAGRRVNKAAGEMRVKTVWDPRCYFNSVLKNGLKATREDADLRRDGIKKGAGFEMPVASDAIVSRPLSEAGRRNFDQIFGGRQAKNG